MPEKIFTKIVRLRQGGPVVTAALLLSLAALLMFVVISTFKSTGMPPVANDTAVTESRQPPLPVMSNSSPAPPEAAAEPSPVPETSSMVAAPEKTVADDHTSADKSQAIHDLQNGTILHNFGWQFHPLYQDWRYHNGVDIWGEEGQIVPALAEGEVLSIYTDQQYGLTVVVKSDQYVVYYSSLASVAVQEKNKVIAGRPIGSMGVNQAEPETHLHLAVQVQDSQEYRDPYEIFPNIFKAD